MAQVPYNPVPNVDPSGAIPRVGLNTPEAAFGGTVGRAIQGLGGTLEGVGNELFSRALAIQQMRNETEATEAGAKADLAMGQAHVDFESKEGKERVDAWPAYRDQLDGIRKQFRDGLSNDAARRMYDRNALGTMNRHVINGAGLTHSAQKAWAHAASQTEVDVAEGNLFNMQNPDDENQKQTFLDQIGNAVTRKMKLEGFDEDSPETANAVSKERSKALGLLLENKARTDPAGARYDLDTYRQQGSMHPEHIMRADAVIKSKEDDVGSRNMANALYEGWQPWVTTSRAKDIQDPIQQVAKIAIRKLGAEGLRVDIARGGIVDENGQGINLVPLDARGRPDPGNKEAMIKIQDAMNEASNETGIPLDSKVHADGSKRGFYRFADYFDPMSAKPEVKPSEKELIDRVREYAGRASPNDPVLADRAAAHIRARFGEDRNAHITEQFDNRQIVEEAMYGGRLAAKPPRTPDDLMAMGRDVEAAWNKLDPSQRNRYVDHMTAKRRTTSDPDEIERLKGMAGEDPEQFLIEDLSGNKNLSDRDKIAFIKLRAEIKKGGGVSADTNYAMRTLAPMLDPSQLDKDSLFKIRGAMQEIMEDFRNTKHFRMPDDQIKAVGAGLLQRRAGSGWFGTNYGAEKEFEQTVPPEHVTKIKEAYQKQYGFEPSDAQVRSIFLTTVARQFQEKFGKK